MSFFSCLPSLLPNGNLSYLSFPSFGARLFCTVSRRALLWLLTVREIEEEAATGGWLALETDEMSKMFSKIYTLLITHSHDHS